MKTICKIPDLHEKQRLLLCGKHAINNLLQSRVATCPNLKRVGVLLSNELDIPLNELISTSGYYDISVLAKFLIDNEDLEVEQIVKKNFKTLSNRQSNRLIGYIFGDGNHWVAVRRNTNINHGPGCYYEIDSLQKEPVRINVVKKWLLENDNMLAIKVLKKK
jgi:hypothetical protein